jgi:hypothetical protein
MGCEIGLAVYYLPCPYYVPNESGGSQFRLRSGDIQRLIGQSIRFATATCHDFKDVKNVSISSDTHDLAVPMTRH